VIPIGVAIALAAQAVPPDSREEAVRSALIATLQGNRSAFTKVVKKGAKVIDLNGRSATLSQKSLVRFTTQCSLFNWGEGGKGPDGNWMIEWECPNGEYVGMDFRFRQHGISKVELLQAPAIIRPPGEYKYAAVRFPQILDVH